MLNILLETKIHSGKQFMFEIAVEQQQYKTYILSDRNAQSQVAIAPERGAIITSWQIGEKEIFYLDKERFSDPSLSVRGGIPLLFPICGNLPDDNYSLDGKSYRLKQHGFARDLPWEVTDRSQEDSASLTLSLKSNEKTRTVYPFDFQLDFTYKLKGNTLELIYRHTNLSDRPMPFATGIHPYFLVTDKNKLEFDLPSSKYKIKSDSKVNDFSGKFDFSQDEIDFAFIDLSNNSASAIDRDRNLKLTLKYDSEYSTLVFWTVKGKDFYCLEPWSAPRDALNTGESILVAKPNETVETSISIIAESLS